MYAHLVWLQVDYEVTGDTTCASNVPRRARMSKLRKVIISEAINSTSFVPLQTNEILSSYTVTLIGEIKEIGTSKR